VGTNPARIIPLWQEFVDDHAPAGMPLRGVGEPVWPERTDDELAECHIHEALLNVAFERGHPWWLVCPYDTTALAPEVIAATEASHPVVAAGAERRVSHRYPGTESLPATVFGSALPRPAGEVAQTSFDLESLAAVRSFVTGWAESAGLATTRAEDLALAAHEAATNSIRHGGGRGTLRVWRDDRAVVCEVSDAGVFGEPLAGRCRPQPEDEGGRGLWIANQLCDLVQVRTGSEGTVVRIHVTFPTH